MASSYDTQNRRAEGAGDEGTQSIAFQNAPGAGQSDAPPKAVWAGVSKGRDGLLGRIETALGSIS